MQVRRPAGESTPATTMTTATDAEHWQRLADERAHALGTLLAVSRTLSSTLELGPLLQEILEQLRVVADYTGASINLVQGGDLVSLEGRAHDGNHAALRGRSTPLTRLGSLWQRLCHGEPVVIADVRDGADAPARAYRVAVGADAPGAPALRYRSTLLAPLVLKGETVGVVGLTQDEPDYYTQRHVELATAIASQAAIAIDNARLYERAQAAAALEERARLARDLHDSVTQSVFSVGLLARTARTLHERGSDDLGTTLGRIEVVAQDALSELRALLYELRPAALDDEGLGRALPRLVSAIQARTDTPIRYTGECHARLGQETETALVRVVQEALANAIKYAQATVITVNLVEASERLVVTVEDDGIGFDPAASVTAATAGQGGGLGLRSMRERAAAAGLRLQVDSAPGAGTRITIAAPRASQ
jgi:signal transduction histidine kinase